MSPATPVIGLCPGFSLVGWFRLARPLLQIAGFEKPDKLLSRLRELLAGRLHQVDRAQEFWRKQRYRDDVGSIEVGHSELRHNADSQIAGNQTRHGRQVVDLQTTIDQLGAAQG